MRDCWLRLVLDFLILVAVVVIIQLLIAVLDDTQGILQAINSWETVYENFELAQ